MERAGEHCWQRPDRFLKPVRSASDDSREYLVAAACSGQYDEKKKDKTGWHGRETGHSGSFC